MMSPDRGIAWHVVYYLRRLGLPESVTDSLEDFFRANVLSRFAAPGSARWLIARELKYGGYISGISPRTVSDKDPRTASELAQYIHVGGDRMHPRHHGYASKYAQYLEPVVTRQRYRPIVLVEVGILRGTGLAIWSDLFPGGQIIGLDIDLDNFLSNIDALKARGAFTHSNVYVHKFDQLLDNREQLSQILDGRRIDVMIDDGFHSDDACLMTLWSALPHLAEEFVYIIEDLGAVDKKIKAQYPTLDIDHQGMLTVLSPRQSN